MGSGSSTAISVILFENGSGTVILLLEGRTVKHIQDQYSVWCGKWGSWEVLRKQGYTSHTLTKKYHFSINILKNSYDYTNLIWFEYIQKYITEQKPHSAFIFSQKNGILEDHFRIYHFVPQMARRDCFSLRSTDNCFNEQTGSSVGSERSDL